ncbi:helix-turn-helix domain-containing protein [uncultured Kordia sp.]|uniref:helix-turn-helix domain-containing protein n=1 Tax=uncultured Kordia sp. TaxID=507699 RepID=UPI002617F72E|nr:helix-turn-helix domain-containing protein [uncultured Kordia sp.]
MLKVTHILCILFLTCTFSHAQKVSAEVLAKQIKSSSVHEKDSIFNEFLDISNKDEVWTKHALDIAYHFYKKEKYDKSMLFTEAVIEVSQKIQNKTDLSKAYLRKGNIYMQQGAHEKALNAYYSLLQIAEQEENLNYQFFARMNIAVIHRMMRQYKKALEKCTEALQIIDQTKYKNKRNHVNLLTILSETYLDMEQLDDALHHIEKGLLISEKLDYSHGKVDLLIKKGIISYKKENFEEALTYLRQAENILKEDVLTNDFYQKTYTNYFLAACFFKQEKYQQTVDQLLKTIKLLKNDTKRDAYILDTYLLLSKSYNKLKNTEQTLLWHDEYLKLNAILEKDEDRVQTNIYEQETQLFKNQIALLKKEKEQSNTIIWYAVGCAAIFIIVWIFTLSKSVKKERSNKVVFNKLTSKIESLNAQYQNLTNKKSAQKLFDIEDEKVARILKGVEKLETSHYFLNLDCSLSAMAKKLKTNRSYLSQIIKTHKKKKFNEYINDLRITYTINRLKTDTQFCKFSIASIAKEVGYKSDYSFVKHFKERTKVKPSDYIKNLLQENA